MPKIALPEQGNIIVIGFPATGKTTLVKELRKQYKKASVYHTDDYIKHGFEEGLYVLMKDLKKDKNKLKIIEGVLGYRLLRKGAELKSFYPDIIINCRTPAPVRIERIKERGKDLRATLSMDKGLVKVWQDFMKINKVKFKLEQYDT